MAQAKTKSRDGPATVKPLEAGDLEGVVAIDSALAGVSRRGFFEKRLAAALDHPGDYIHVGLHVAGRLSGYALAKLVDGEFGAPGARASLDAIGVDPARQDEGAGHRLLGTVEEILRRKGVGELTSQVDWRAHGLAGFLGEAGFALAPRIVLTRDTGKLQPRDAPLRPASGEIDHSFPDGDDPDALSLDRVPVRSMQAADLDAIIAIDAKASGRDRPAYFRRKQDEALNQSGVRLSLIAEADGLPVGFVMARMDFGEFGRASAQAVMDTIAVDPGFQGHGIGHGLISRLLDNLSVLRVERVRTQLDWNATDLITFLDKTGFVPAQCVVLRRSL